MPFTAAARGYAPAISSGNGLLTGLTEAWRPDASLAMIGQKTGMNTGTDAGLSYVDQAGFPGGRALGNGFAFLQTPASALVESIGFTDFCLIEWFYDAVTGQQGGINIGENNNNGCDITQHVTLMTDAEIPGADSSYPVAPGVAYTADTPHMACTYYLTATNTLYCSIDGGTPTSIVNTAGIGTADPTNAVGFGVITNKYFGPAYLWQGTVGVANAVSQLSSLYTNKLRYSDFT